MFAKVFTQIFDSSIVEKPEVRFTFTDLLTLCDVNGVVDMTHEAISRRTNRPLRVIKETIAELEGPDPRSRTPDFDGARIKRLDEHRDWGWMIVNYEKFRATRDEEARREYRREWMAEKRKEDPSYGRGEHLVNSVNASEPKQKQKKIQKQTGEPEGKLKLTFPEGSAEAFKTVFKKWMQARKGIGKKPKDWAAMFQAQLDWIAKQPAGDWIEICEQSIRNGWQGLFEVKRNGSAGAAQPQKKWKDV